MAHDSIKENALFYERKCVGNDLVTNLDLEEFFKKIWEGKRPINLCELLSSYYADKQGATLRLVGDDNPDKPTKLQHTQELYGVGHGFGWARAQWMFDWTQHYTHALDNIPPDVDKEFYALWEKALSLRKRSPLSAWAKERIELRIQFDKINRRDPA